MISGEFPADAQATLTIWLNRIIENYTRCVDLAGGTTCSAMVKADAYGMGIEQVAPALFYNTQCKNFFVANLAEAIKLRRFVPDAIIYVLNGFFPNHLDYMTQNDIRPVLNDWQQIRQWSKVPPKNRPSCAIHFDTGISRLGLTPDETELFIADQSIQNHLDISLIMSHLACSDDAENPMNKRQLSDFTAITQQFPNIPASLANSGGILLGHEYHFDLARPGLMLFGGNPSIKSMPENIKPTFEITGKILQIRKLNQGQSVGYGATWTANNDCHIATINVGYADGYLQMFNNCGRAYIKNTEVPVIGRVSMDMIAIDVSKVMSYDITPGDNVELLGEHITLEKASEVSTLSQYEILTGVRERYQRIYI